MINFENLMNLGGHVRLELTPDDLQMFARSVVEHTLAAQEQMKTDIAEESTETYLTTLEVRELLHVCDGTLITWAKRGYLIPVKVGGKKRFAKSDVMKILSGNRTETVAAYCRRKRSTTNG